MTLLLIAIVLLFAAPKIKATCVKGYATGRKQAQSVLHPFKKS